MKYDDYVSALSFRLIKPSTPLLPVGDARFRYWLKFGVLFEYINTKLPCYEQQMRGNWRRIWDIPKMSTLAIGAMINMGVSQMSDEDAFLNVGVWHGFTFLSGVVDNPGKHCIGVDNFSEFGSPQKSFLERFNKYKNSKHNFYRMDYIDYLSKIHQDPIGFYIYDGSHSYKHQLKGLQLAEPYFSDGCIILVDDANYDEVRKATMDFLAVSEYEYQTLLDKTTFCNYHPTLWNGVIILRKI